MRIATYITVVLLAIDMMLVVLSTGKPRPPREPAEVLLTLLYTGWVFYLILYWMARAS